MNFLYRNRSAARIPKINHWQNQQNVLDAKMHQCHQNILEARTADNYQGLLDAMSELEMVVEEQKRRLGEVRRLKDEARARLQQLELLEKGLVEKEREWPRGGWVKEEKEKARLTMTQKSLDIVVDPPTAGQLDAVLENPAMVMDVEQSL